MKKNTPLFLFKEKFNCSIRNNLKMKLSILLIFLSILSVLPNNGYSQKKITLNVKDIIMKDVLNEIKSQTDFKFLYRSKEIDVRQKVSLKANRETIVKVLDRLFKNTQITYKIIDNQVVLTKRSLEKKKISLKIEDEFTYSSNNEAIINIEPIYFDYNSSRIKESSSVELDKIVSIMNKYPELVIVVSSHTDSRGKSSYNERLSTKRAESSARYITGKGRISILRVTARGYGESQLTNRCSDGVKCSKKEHDLNRRTEFVIDMTKSSK